MSNVFPVTQPTLRPYRGPNTSAEVNTLVQDVFYDVMTLCTAVNEQAQHVGQLAETTAVSNTFLHLKVSELENRLKQIEDDIVNAQATVKRAHTWASDFQVAPASVGLRQASIDRVHGVAVLPEASAAISKVYLTDNSTGAPILPKTLQVAVNPVATGGVTETNPLYAVDGHDHNAWVRQVSLPVTNTTAEVQASLIVTLPDNIISNRDCNLITIHPFPIRGVDVMNVEAKVNGNWQSIPGFVGPVLDAGPIRLSFAPIQITELRVTLRQRRWIEKNQFKTFYMGVQDVGISSQAYAGERGDLLIPVKLPGIGSKLITAITPIMANTGTLSDTTNEKRSLFAYEVYTKDADGNLVFTKDQLPILVNVQEVVLKATLYADPANGVTPALAGVECAYSITP